MDHSDGNPSGGASRDPLSAFAELGQVMFSDAPAEAILRRVAELAKQGLAGVADVSLTLIENGRPRSVVFTGPLAVDLDERQYELGFGPCLDAARTGQTIVVDGEGDGSPYRAYAEVAARAGVRHTVSVGMPIAERSVGGLNMYSTDDAPVSEAFVERAEAFAGYAAATVANVASYARVSARVEHLQRALNTRAVIEQAKGVIIARDRCTPDEAFEVLTRISQHEHIKIRDLARAIVDAAQ